MITFEIALKRKNQSISNSWSSNWFQGKVNPEINAKEIDKTYQHRW